MKPPFTPGASQVIAVTGSSAATALSSPIGQSIRLHCKNTNSGYVFVAFGASSATATTTTSLALPPGAIETFTLPLSTTHIACIGESAGQTLYATTGEGE